MAVPRQLPNTITVVRILMAPVFLWMLLVDGGADGPLRWWAAVLFIVAIATDGIDGWIARRYEIVTDLGKLLDPIADKVLTGFAFIGLSILGELPWWITITIAVRELGVTLLRFWVIRYGVIAASYGGKAKTLAQIIAIGLFLLPLPAWFDPVEWTAMGIALVLTIVTGADYVVRAIRLRARG
jgi:CDP-diacylglycerol---glycerol-3-phosphate 3-phosphatidyltransferase